MRQVQANLVGSPRFGENGKKRVRAASREAAVTGQRRCTILVNLAEHHAPWLSANGKRDLPCFGRDALYQSKIHLLHTTGLHLLG